MNNTPTPRTDEAQFGTGRVSVNFARRLERELAAVTEQLKEAHEEIVKLTKGWADCVLKRSKAEEQRDRLAEECAKIRDVAERAIDYLDQSYRDGFSDEVSELRYELAAVKGGADE